MPQTDQILPSPKVANLLGIKPGTLRAWRVLGKGPRFIRIGGSVFYRVSEVESWLKSHEFSSTSEVDAA